MTELQCNTTMVGSNRNSRCIRFSLPCVYILRLLGVMMMAVLVNSLFISTAIAQDSNTTSESQPGRTTNGVPLFEKKHELLYRFGREPSAVLKPAVDLNRPESLFRFDVHTTENIQHSGRETLIASDVQSQFYFAQRMRRTTPKNAAVNLYDLYIYPYQLTFSNSKMGENARTITLDPEFGLIQSYRDGRTTRTAFADSFGRSGSLLASIARPLRMYLKNGALQENPAESPFLETLRLSWINSAFLTLLPPLPQKKMRTSHTWQGFIMIQASQYSQPASVPCTFVFRSYDDETQLAEVAWSIDRMSVSLSPVPGIHHITNDSVAVITAAGVTTFDLTANRVKSAEAMIKANINRTKDKTFAVQTVRTLHLRSVK